MITQKDLECEMEELRLEIKENAERIDKLCNLLKQNNTKLRKIKEMNDAQRNTNEAVENKLQPRNWKVETMNANYPMLEVVDENTVKIEGVEYKKVQKKKPQTLLEIILDWWVQDWTGDSQTICKQLVDTIERWMTQYECDYVVCAEYLQGYNALMETLKANLK